jgi:hypothetical protein
MGISKVETILCASRPAEPATRCWKRGSVELAAVDAAAAEETPMD